MVAVGGCIAADAGAHAAHVPSKHEGLHRQCSSCRARVRSAGPPKFTDLDISKNQTFPSMRPCLLVLGRVVGSGGVCVGSGAQLVSAVKWGARSSSRAA